MGLAVHFSLLFLDEIPSLTVDLVVATTRIGTNYGPEVIQTFERATSAVGQAV